MSSDWLLPLILYRMISLSRLCGPDCMDFLLSTNRWRSGLRRSFTLTMRPGKAGAHIRHTLGLALAAFSWMFAFAPATAFGQTASDAAVEQLVERAARGPDDLGESVTRLTRMGAFDAVNTLLERAAAANWSQDQVRSAARQIPVEVRLRLAVRPELTETARAWIDRTSDVLRAQLQSPERLRQAIEQLDARQVDTHLPAVRTLLAGGQASLLELMNVLADTPPEQVVRRQDMLGMLLRLDRQLTYEGLERLVLYGKPSQRISALDALLRLDPNAAPLIVATAVHAVGNEWKEVSSFAVETLTDQGYRLPSRSKAVQMLRQSLAETMQFALNSDADDGTRTVWVLDAGGKLTLQQADALAARYRSAVDVATQLTLIADNEFQSSLSQWNAQLAYRVVNDPDWGDPEQVASIIPLLPEPRGRLGSSSNGASENGASGFVSSAVGRDVRLFWLEALHEALEHENDAAVIGNLRVIAEKAEPDSAALWFMTEGRSATPLVQAVDYPHPTVRSEAASVIVALRPQASYPGQNRVVRRLQQMQGLASEPIGVILENRPEVVQVWIKVMNQAGFETKVVSSAKQLEQFIATGGDVRLIAIKEQPVDAGTIEVIDRIRRIPMSRDVPIVVYADPVRRPTTELLDAREAFEALSEEEQADAMSVEGRLGVSGGLENIAGIEDLDLVGGDLNVNRTSVTRRRIDLETIARQRWRDVSRRAGLIRYMTQPRSALGLFELTRESERSWHVPPPSITDRQRYRQIAKESLAVPQS